MQCFNQVRVINVRGLEKAFELRGLCLLRNDMGLLHILAKSKLTSSL